MKEQVPHPLDLLPFFVNGSLEADEKQQVARHLAACERCRDELALLQALHASLRAVDHAEAPKQLGWQRLQRHMRQPKPAPTRRWLPWALAASVLIVVVQTVLLLRTPGDPALYVPAGSVIDAPVIQVRFHSGATEAQIREVLEAVDGRLIDGPGVLGVYRVQLAIEPGDKAAFDEKLAWLRAQGEVIAYAARD